MKYIAIAGLKIKDDITIDDEIWVYGQRAEIYKIYDLRWIWCMLDMWKNYDIYDFCTFSVS